MDVGKFGAAAGGDKVCFICHYTNTGAAVFFVTD